MIWPNGIVGARVNDRGDAHLQGALGAPGVRLHGDDACAAIARVDYGAQANGPEAGDENGVEGGEVHGLHGAEGRAERAAG